LRRQGVACRVKGWREEGGVEERGGRRAEKKRGKLLPHPQGPLGGSIATGRQLGGREGRRWPASRRLGVV
jgi:hypothetical protein